MKNYYDIATGFWSRYYSLSIPPPLYRNHITTSHRRPCSTDQDVSPSGHVYLSSWIPEGRAAKNCLKSITLSTFQCQFRIPSRSTERVPTYRSLIRPDGTSSRWVGMQISFLYLFCHLPYSAIQTSIFVTGFWCKQSWYQLKIFEDHFTNGNQLIVHFKFCTSRKLKKKLKIYKDSLFS